MKVEEKGTDRKAEVHLRADGEVTALREYGQYVDATDNAICCYVAMEEDKSIVISGKLFGTVR